MPVPRTLTREHGEIEKSRLAATLRYCLFFLQLSPGEASRHSGLKLEADPNRLLLRMSDRAAQNPADKSGTKQAFVPGLRTTNMSVSCLRIPFWG